MFNAITDRLNFLGNKYLKFVFHKYCIDAIFWNVSTKNVQFHVPREFPVH